MGPRADGNGRLEAVELTWGRVSCAGVGCGARGVIGGSGCRVGGRAGTGMQDVVPTYTQEPPLLFVWVVLSP